MHWKSSSGVCGVVGVSGVVGASVVVVVAGATVVSMFEILILMYSYEIYQDS